MIGLRLNEAWRIARQTHLLHARSMSALAGYYLLTMISAFCDGLGLVLLVSLVTGKYGDSQPDFVSLFVINLLKLFNLDASKPTALLIVAVLFAVKTIILMALSVVEARFTAAIRRRLQESAYTSSINAEWEVMRNQRTGQLVGQLTEEAGFATRCLTSFIKAIYYAITSVIFGLLAVAVSFQITLLMFAVAVPLLIGLRRTMVYQSRVSMTQTSARQAFTADIAERLGNLFFIKTQGSEALNITAGNRHQPEIARLELMIGYCQAFIANFNAILVLVALGTFYVWAVYTGQLLQDALHGLAAVGTVGARAASHFNNTAASLGTISRFSGSLPLLRQLMDLKASPVRTDVPERVVCVDLADTEYRIDGRILVPSVNANSSVGAPLRIRGPSGSGKTTTANLVAGIFRPSAGQVKYVGESGKIFDATQFKARIGYVTQDIVMFHGTVRDNLMPTDGLLTDEELWDILEQVGASHFIHSIGGLDVIMAEAGRSMSGGERRRLGIARALACQADIIILDEVSNGLDDRLKSEIAALINAIAARRVVIAITHDRSEFQDWNTLQTGSESV